MKCPVAVAASLSDWDDLGQAILAVNPDAAAKGRGQQLVSQWQIGQSSSGARVCPLFRVVCLGSDQFSLGVVGKLACSESQLASTLQFLQRPEVKVVGLGRRGVQLDGSPGERLRSIWMACQIEDGRQCVKSHWQ